MTAKSGHGVVIIPKRQDARPEGQEVPIRPPLEVRTMAPPDLAEAPTARIPLLVKILYTAFVAVLVPAYWQRYGPTNFLYFCDVALLLTVPALWLEDALLASACLVGIFVPQLLWQIDFVIEA